jgi:chloramphenicol-sensitive protein RarD
VTPDRPAGRDTTGLLFGLGAYVSWGVFPAFFPLLKPAGPAEILAHRIVWTVLFMAVVLVAGGRERSDSGDGGGGRERSDSGDGGGGRERSDSGDGGGGRERSDSGEGAAVGRLSDVRSLSRRTWLLLVCAAALISTNWLIYIYAVNSAHVVDAALGYFINPLVSVLLGVLLFGERLNRAQGIAVLIAAIAVALLSGGAGGAPLIALGLAVSFGLYGAVKKVVPVDPRVSVAVETAVASPFALAYLAALQLGGTGQFTGNGPGHVVLLLLCGPITAVPLLCFAAAAQRLPLVTLGLLQYLTPSMQMTWGLVVGQEPMTTLRWIGFALIWLALAVFSADALRRTRARQA